MPNKNVFDDLIKRIENGTLDFLQEDSEFVAGCVQCGQCCRNREDILLSPHDVFHMVKATGMPVVEMLKKYTEVYLGPNSNLPVVRVDYRKESDGTTTCPFLGKKDSKYYCRIHDNKPYVCRSYPLGRMSKHILGEEKNTNEDSIGPSYFLQPMYGPLCPGMTKATIFNSKHTVCEWIGGKEKKNAADKYWVLFDRFTNELERTINLKEFYNLKNEQLKQACFNMMMNLMYIEYDFNGDEESFLAQYKDNTDTILEYAKLLSLHPAGKLKPKNSVKNESA